MLSWARIDWPMSNIMDLVLQMSESSRGEDKKLHVNNYLMSEKIRKMWFVC